MNHIERAEFNEYLYDLLEDFERDEYYSDFEEFCHGLTDKEIDCMLDRRSRTDDMSKEFK